MYNVGDLKLNLEIDGLSALNALEDRLGSLGKGGKGSSGTGGSASSALKNFNLGFAFTKVRTIIGGIKKMTRLSVKLLQYGSDYTETLNLWQVAMRGNVNMASDFVSKMNKAYGVSEKTLMNAQAIFKNMIGSLGQISDDMAYALSESITKMAIDYSSLYNVSIDSAITKFQAALAGQVRPIRSVSGYDITENTIYQLYQSIGGTKTVRQLSRTEKQLLSILAIFKQMDASGALGDMEKTIDSAANQSRMIAENFATMMTWAGVAVQYILEEYDVLKYINAALIFMGELFKYIAYSLGYETPDFAKGWASNVEDTNKAVDDLQGKLLGFDKFRSLSGAEENVLGIDTALLEALKDYNFNLDESINKARELAEAWTSWLIDDETGEFTKEAKDLGKAIKDIGTFVGILIGYNLLEKTGSFTTTLFTLNVASKSFQSILVTGVVFAIIKAIEAFDAGSTWGGILAIAIGVTLVGAFVALKIAQTKATMATILHNTAIATGNPIMEAAALKTAKAAKGYGLLASGIAAATAGLTLLLSNDAMGWGQKMISIVVALAAAITAAAIAMNTFHMNWPGAVGVAGLVASGVLTVSSALGSLSVKKFKEGGLVEDGLFTMNKGEVMGTFDDGTSIVANNQQIISGIKQGVYQAVSQAMANSGRTDDRPIDVYIDGERVFQATKKNAKRHGLAFSKV